MRIDGMNICNKCGLKKSLTDFRIERRMTRGYGNTCLDCMRGRPRLKARNGAGYQALGYSGKQINGVRKFDHVRMVEAVLGCELPSGAVVHHVNKDRGDNRNENFVLCPNKAYHNLLHARMDAYDACGNYDWRKCRRCGKYDDIRNLSEWKNASTISRGHPECEKEYMRQYMKRKNICQSVL